MEKDLIQQPSLCKRIAFVGPESTGKTTLCELMASLYHTQWVKEYMRLYLQEKWDKQHAVCTWEDLLPIAKGQIRLENEALSKAIGYLFCDTCLLELVIYSYIYYGKCDPVIEHQALNHKYEHIFLTYIDTPWVPDDLRDKPEERAEIFTFFKDFLEKKSIPFHLLKGNIDDRVEQINQKLTR
ncbi:AAA family ATPase [Capnocytophaga granulosa]|uniref:AAA family ATPase n=1 Tax=Capnocytophaga granulosa TaxID=45242 RepID=UPI003857CEF4